MKLPDWDALLDAASLVWLVMALFSVVAVIIVTTGWWGLAAVLFTALTAAAFYRALGR